MYDIQKIREDFPILGREVYGKPLIYLDNGATTQKPRCVVEAITRPPSYTKPRVKQSVSLSMHAVRMKSCLHGELLKVSTCWLLPLPKVR